MPRYKSADRERLVAEARRRLLDAALGEFAAQGYAGANINHISLAAGFAQGTVYNYYPSKRALFAAVIGDIAARQGELVLQGAASAPTPAMRLERFLAAGLAFAQGFPAAARLVAATLYGADAEARALAQHAYEPLASYVTKEIVLAGQQEGTFRTVDAELAGAAIMALYLCGCTAHGAPLRANPRAAAALILEGLRRGT
ncbi:MAG TPA: TetR/AcrR family transcriptional regulator [Anaerolineae bacterium]|nr:TetR/AcrR family transcriptional regulator [Anaerolineae bacterium]HOQ97997.1 TetR/AcrR family transcriptional regulator [Anaerolineae bacterium]HPL26686.1 TetR/AcrR family transcriptional regulator [Anaerolineae bacterium]